MLLLRREHEAIVNHQLCITNTFEQVFKEKMLKLYKKVRYLCNTHGYPFTKNIHSKYLADLIYLKMKLLCYFLLIIYLVDSKLKNCIAM